MGHKLVLIEWVDSYGGTTGWKPLEDCTPDVLTVRSVGWLVHDDDDVKVLVPHIVEPPIESRIAAQGRGDMAIPCAAICSIHEVIKRDNGQERNTMTASILSLQKPPFELNFAWPISDNTSVKIILSGELPSEADVTFLSQVLDLAKQQITRAVAAKRKADSDVEVLVEAEGSQ